MIGRWRPVGLLCAVAAVAFSALAGIGTASASASIYGYWSLDMPEIVCCKDTPVSQSFNLMEPIDPGNGLQGHVDSAEIHNGAGLHFVYFILEHSEFAGIPSSSFSGNSITLGTVEDTEVPGFCPYRWYVLEGSIDDENSMHGTFTGGTISYSDPANCASGVNTQEKSGVWNAYRGAAASSLSVADTTVGEPFSGTHTANFPVTLSKASSSPVTVAFATHDGTGAEGAVASNGDYEATSGNLTFNPGETTKSIPVTVKANKVKSKLKFKVTLSAPSGASLASAEATGTIQPNPKLSGHVYTNECGAKLCKQSPYPGQTILVQGKAGDGTAVDTSAVTGPDGSWSVNVPSGSYVAGPTVDGKTIEGPGWDPEKTDPITVASADVPGLDFRTCAANAGASASAARSSRAGATGRSGAQASIASPYQYLCEATYTFQAKAAIPIPTFADPSPLAPFAVRQDGTGFQADNQDSGPWQEQLPECEKFNKERDHPKPLKWLSYYQGHAKLGTATISLNYYRTTEDLTDEQLKIVPGSMTRIYKYAGSAGKGECRITREVTPLTAISTKHGGEFQIVISWPIPFLPRGYEPPPDFKKLPGVANRLHALLDEAAEEVPAFKKLPEPAKQAVIYAAAETVEHLGMHGLKHYPSKADLTQLIASSVAVEKATNIPILLYNVAASQARSKQDYHPATMAIRGKLVKTPCAKLGRTSVDGCTITSLAQDVTTQEFPDYQLTELRSGKGGGSRALPIATVPNSVVVSSASDAGPLPGHRHVNFKESKGGVGDMQELWIAMLRPLAPAAPQVAAGATLSGTPPKDPECTITGDAATIAAKNPGTRCFGFPDGLP